MNLLKYLEKLRGEYCFDEEGASLLRIKNEGRVFLRFI